jgi:hypothetical protein
VVGEEALLVISSYRELDLQWEKAMEVFLKGIEVDGPAEEFYQHLMICYTTKAPGHEEGLLF